MSKKLFPLILLLIITPGLVAAHQPRIVESRQTAIVDPQISKAFYGQLIGEPDVFTIISTSSFPLYVNILVPDSIGQTTDVSAAIAKDGTWVATLDGTTFTWTPMFEQFGYDNYLKGPEYKATGEAGTYIVTVTSSNNNSKYSLAIGEVEKFDTTEIINALTLVPQLKRTFFNESPINFILSPFGWGLIVVLYILAIIVGFTYRFVIQKFSKTSVLHISQKQNIGTSDRLLRLVIAVTLLLWAITTTWSPILIFFSGFALFEALFSWCGLYAALGKNTCPS